MGYSTNDQLPCPFGSVDGIPRYCDRPDDSDIRRLSAVQSDTRAAIVKYDDGSTGCVCVSLFLTGIGTDSQWGRAVERKSVR